MKDETIYINGRFLTQKITGVQRYAIEVLKKIDNLETNKKIVVLYPKNIISNLDLKNIECRQIGNLKGHLWEQMSLPFYIFRHNRKSKLINFCNLGPVLYPGYVVLHDISFKTHPEHLDWKFFMLYRIITRLNIKRYKHIFTVSEFSKKEILENYKIKQAKITVTYDSAEHIKEINPNETIVKRLKLENKKFNFSLGSRSPHKNHKFIVECARQNPEMLFVVSGNNNNKVFKGENDNEELNNLIYTGYLNDEELVTMYKKCNCFIFPSLYEGFGIPPLEAIECGCNAIILSDIEVLHEIYGDIANYIDPYNIETLPKEKIKMITEEERKKIVNKYSWDNTAKKILKIICQ